MNPSSLRENKRADWVLYPWVETSIRDGSLNSNWISLWVRLWMQILIENPSMDLHVRMTMATAKLGHGQLPFESGVFGWRCGSTDRVNTATDTVNLLGIPKMLDLTSQSGLERKCFAFRAACFRTDFLKASDPFFRTDYVFWNYK